MRVPVPDELLPADRLGRVHFVGIGGAGLSGIARIMLARGITGQRQRRQGLPRPRGAARARRPLLRRPRRRAGAATPTRSWSRPRSARTTPRCVEAARRGLRLLPRSAALESVMQGRRVVAVAGTHGKTTTTSLLTVALQHCGADPSFAIGGELNETGSNAARRHRRPLRRRGRRERRRLPRLLAVRARWSPTSRPTTSTTTAPRRPTTRPSRRSSTGSTRPASWSPASTTPGPPTCAEQARGAGPDRGRRRAESPSADLRAERPARSPASTSRVHRGRPRPPARRGDACRSPAGTTSSTRSPPSPPGCGSASPFADLRARARGVHRHPAGGWSSRARPAGVRVYDSYAHHPNEIAGDLQAARVAGGRGPAWWSPSSRTWSRAPGSSAPRWARRSAPPTRSS